MICPRCNAADIAEDGHCALCSYSPATDEILQEPATHEVAQVVEQSVAGRFHIQALLRLGERSLVYLAHEAAHDRLVALKVIPVSGGVTPQLARAFEHQAALAASLRHPHIVAVHGYGRSATLLWYALEHVRGRSLGDLLRETGPLDFELCFSIAHQVAGALRYAHRRGVSHGNLKPSNVFLGVQLDDPWALVSDFAILDAFGHPVPCPTAGPALRLPQYMAPEQFYARRPVVSSDQYALAVIVYQCLSGTVPFIGDSFEQVALRQARDVAPPLASLRRDVRPGVSEAVSRALSKDVADRFPSVGDFVTALAAGSASPVPPLAPARERPPARPSGSIPPIVLLEPETRPHAWKRWLLLALLGLLAVAGFALRDHLRALAATVLL